MSVAASGGTCREPFALETACPAGSWPGFGGAWGPRLQVAGGDTVTLAFDASMSSVRVASTSNFRPDAPAPPGQSTIDQSEDLPPTTATGADADGKLWTVVLPHLGARSRGGSLTFSVAALDATGGAHDYPLFIGAPRESVYGGRCDSNAATYNFANTFFFNPDDVEGCSGPSVPPGGPRPPTNSVPVQAPPGVGRPAGQPTATTSKPSAVDRLRLAGARWRGGRLILDVVLGRRARVSIVVRAHGRVLATRRTGRLGRGRHAVRLSVRTVGARRPSVLSVAVRSGADVLRTTVRPRR